MKTVTEKEFLAQVFSCKHYEDVVIPEYLDGAKEAIRTILLDYSKGIKIIPNNDPVSFEKPTPEDVRSE